MGAPPGSQVAPLPTDLPFRLISKTIGQGAYASIRKATPHGKTRPVIAVKFINKEHAFRTGRLREKQLELEIGLHDRVCPHEHIIRFLSFGQDSNWIYMCLELAEGGDLFDKIEADEGVGEDVAHLYFAQLTSAIGWCHGRGVAHRDIKPENMLLSAEGDLKLADFGLATQFLEPKTGKRKVCGMVCGSPPYIAPEILAVGHANLKRKSGEGKTGYDPQIADVWSCAIVLFVLLAGNTPWDSPVKEESWEYAEYIRSQGRPEDELWEKVPAPALSLLRGMLKIEPKERMSLEDVRRHPWFTKPNPHLNNKGKAADPIVLATQMLERLHINFDRGFSQSTQSHAQSQRARRRATQPGDDMSIDRSSLQPGWTNFSSTQPDTPISDLPFEWEAPPRPGHMTASQPTTAHDRTNAPLDPNFLAQLSEDPSMSQFAPTPSVPLTLTQQARQFKDIMPSYSMTRFLSSLPLPQLLSQLTTALHRLNIPVPPIPSSVSNPARGNNASGGEPARIRIKAVDLRQQPLHGVLHIEPFTSSRGDEVLEVRFIKAKGDPVGWRRLFKDVVVLCREGLVLPGQV